MPLIFILFMGAPSGRAASEPDFIKIMSILPEPGSVVGPETVLRAQLQYHIEKFDHTTRYQVVPMFKAIDGVDFNDLMDGVKIPKRAGTIDFSYPIRRQVQDPKLGKPMKCRFAIVFAKGGFIGTLVSSDQVTYTIK